MAGDSLALSMHASHSRCQADGRHQPFPPVQHWVCAASGSEPASCPCRVTEENKREYVNLVARHRMTTAIKAQINAFLQGFRDLAPKVCYSRPSPQGSCLPYPCHRLGEHSLQLLCGGCRVWARISVQFQPTHLCKGQGPRFWSPLTSTRMSLYCCEMEAPT